ncbi:MAG TPA: hypothetical protein PKL77_07205 [Candidatus Omnitrophota bacterium]|nr:hypothetical protein [Candidatus Omnitrophota bacterium]
MDALFAMNKTYPVTFSTLTTTDVNGQETEPVWTPVLSTRCIVARGTASMKYVSDRLKPDVVATLFLHPRDCKVKIPEGTKAVVTIGPKAEDVEAYSVILPDNVGQQNEAIVIPCKKFS